MMPPRVLVLSTTAEVDAELARLGSDRAGRAIMSAKGVLRVVRLDGIDPRAANILKQELLAKGGECALSRDVYDLPPGSTTSAVVMGTERELAAVLKVLPAQPFGLKKVGAAIEQALAWAEEAPAAWRCGRFSLPVGEATQVMGILNVTPDSFSEEGDLFDPEAAIAAGRRMATEGAHILDVGGESTRPGAAAVSEEEEIGRVLPVIEALVGADGPGLPVSADTRKPGVAARALEAGASIVNDVAGFRDPALVEVVAGSDCGCIVMHMQGEPGTMQEAPHYDDLLGEVYAFLAERTEALMDAGVARERIAVDPGIGFGKTFEHNLELIRRLGELLSLGFPVVLGTSRKRFIGAVLGVDDPKDRLEGTATTVTAGILSGAAVVRVHDVKEMARVARMADAVRTGRVGG
jgi:dihydropteroate synthase